MPITQPRAQTLSLLLSVGLMAACSGKGEDSGTTYVAPVDSGEPEPDCDLATDADCDGVPDSDDCDPNDPTTYPGATEIPYDGADNDCAGDGDLVDVDGDGFTSDRVEGGDDCNDGDPNAYPGAPETCNGRDDNCDGWPEDPAEEEADCDGDGYGPGVGGDCDDENPDVYPGAEDAWYDGIDGDCAGDNDYDADGDGDESAEFSSDGGDCDDTDPNTYTDAQELIDGRDNDCDDVVDTLSTFDGHASYFGTTSSGDGWNGIDIAPVGDLDGDGITDYAMGGPFGDSNEANCYFSYGDEGIPCNGWVQLMSGAEGSSDPPGTVAYGTIEGNGSWLGWKLEAIGDLTGDGKAELLVGAPNTSTVFLFDGTDLARGGSMSESDAISSYSGGDYYGIDVSQLRDNDGDGLPEIIASRGFNDQAIATLPTDLAVWSSDTVGGGAHSLGNAEFVLTGTDYGGEVTGNVDLDGDGLGDLVVAASLSSTGKLVFVPGTDITGGVVATVSSYSGPAGETGDQFGTQLTVLPDVDGDGIDDIAANAPAALGQAAVQEGGLVRVLSGADLPTSTSANADAIFIIDGTLDFGGLAVTGESQGDIDGDGETDLIVSYLGGSTLGVVTGRSHIFYGPDIAAGGTVVAEDATTTLTTRFAGDRYGYGGAIFDINNDGADDVVMGAFAGSSDRGMVVRYNSGW